MHVCTRPDLAEKKRVGREKLASRMFLDIALPGKIPHILGGKKGGGKKREIAPNSFLDEALE